MATSDLERQLRELGGEIAFPATPDLVRAVRARIRPEPAWRRWRFVLAAAAMVLITLAITAAAVPDARRAVAGFLGLPGFQVRKVKVLPSPSPNQVGRPVSIDEARRLAGFTLLVPSPPEKIRAVAFDAAPPGGEVELDLAGGAVVTEVTGNVDSGVFGKMVAPNGKVTEVDVGGSKGYWFTGDVHVFFYSDAGGNFRNDVLRLAGDTLVFERNGVLVRVEGAHNLADAQRIAALLN
jgi:hypothetical protein